MQYKDFNARINAKFLFNTAQVAYLAIYPY